MYIDFHIHAFADKIADKAILSLEETSGTKALTRGGINETVCWLDSHGIDMAVLLPIATKPSQQKVINNWAGEVNGGRIISFGSIHPDAEDVIEELYRIKESGLKGVKFHPDYQGFFVSEERMFPIYEKIAQLGLIAVFHAGVDPVSPELIHGDSRQFTEVFERVPRLKTVLAHLGGMEQFDFVEENLAGRYENVWFDTAFLTGYISDQQLYRIIKKQGADRILLASDLPWDDTTNEISQINRLPLSKDEKEMIFYKNAADLLGLNLKGVDL